MKYIENISRVVIRRGDQILLCKNKEFSRYFLPGGHVEFGDTIEKTVYKELNEEIGLNEDKIKNLKYHDILENIFGEGEKKRHEINFIFTANLDDSVEIISQESEIDFEWKNIHDLENITFYPREMIEKIKEL